MRLLVWLCRLAIASCVIFSYVYFRYLEYDYTYHANKRANAAKAVPDSPSISWEKANPIEIAVVWPHKYDAFIAGTYLAAEEINRLNSGRGIKLRNHEGGEYYRQFKIRYFDELALASERDFERVGVSEFDPKQSAHGHAIARQIALDANIMAVVGHSEESIMPATVVYNSSNVLFIAPSNTERVTLHGFKNVFRTEPGYRQVAQAMVDAINPIAGQKQIRLAVLYPSSLKKSPADIGNELTMQANSLIESAGYTVNLSVVSAKEYRRGQSDYRKDVAPFIEWHENYDVILILDASLDALNLRRQLEKGFARDKRKRELEKLVLDLRGLDMHCAQLDCVDYDKSVEMVLRETTQSAVVLASRDSYGTSLGAEIRTSIGETFDDLNRPLRLEMYRSYQSQSKSSYLEVVAEVVQKRPDFVFLAGTGESAINLIRYLREAGLDRAIICGPDLESLLIANLTLDPKLRLARPLIDSWINEQHLSTNQGLFQTENLVDKPATISDPLAELLERLKEKGYNCAESDVRGYVAEREGGTYVASVFDSESLRPLVKSFVSNYRTLYHFDSVDALAAQGYQAIQLLREAFERAGSTDPETAAAALRLFTDHEGLLGRNRFSANGDLQGLEIVFKRRNPDGVNLIRLKTAAPRQPVR